MCKKDLNSIRAKNRCAGISLVFVLTSLCIQSRSFSTNNFLSSIIKTLRLFKNEFQLKFAYSIPKKKLNKKMLRQQNRNRHQTNINAILLLLFIFLFERQMSNCIDTVVCLFRANFAFHFRKWSKGQLNIFRLAKLIRAIGNCIQQLNYEVKISTVAVNEMK